MVNKGKSKKKNYKKIRNMFKCPLCGFAILSEANSRSCAKCDTPMDFIKKI